LLQQLVGEQVRVSIEMPAEPVYVRLDPTGFEQVLMNLAANARDAMLDGGVLTVRASAVSLGGDAQRSRPWTKTGDYVRLSVVDTGVGMEPAVAAHIFEPFFTTKTLGKGTGLGLAVVHGLVEQHGGFVDLDTAPGRGTTFHLHLPRQEQGTGPAARTDRPTGTERLLLVDGEERLRAFAEEVLRESGYHVSVALDPAQASQQLSAAEDVDAVILDVSLADAGPAALVQRVRAARSGVKVLLVSPYLIGELRALERSLPGVQILLKPYAPAQLLDGVRQLLDQPEAVPEPAAKRRVLVVDDEASICTLCERLLQELCDVEVAASGEAALARLSQGRFDLLLTDVFMPGMDGIELIRQAAHRQPDLKIVVMTGSMAGAVEQRLMANGRSHEVLRKPFQATALQDVIRRYLD
ncbi:MAG: response regulator, partial [Dehalococcoidia bacterium]|nr:response regulator [Dehalococcoidia bacterium]